MRKQLITLAIALMTFVAAASVIIDSTDRRPVNAVSVFGTRGNLIGMTDSTGRIPEMSSSDLPLTFRAVGYTPLTIEELTDTIALSPQPVELSEVAVTGDKSGVHMLCYIRECSTGSSSQDTLLIFTEYMADFILPFHDKVKKFKSQRTPRVLKRRNVAVFRRADAPDSIVHDYDETFPWLILASMDGGARTEPESIRTLTVGADTTYSKKTRTISRKNGTTYSVQHDMLYGRDGHTWSPGIFKVFGLTMDFTELFTTEMYALQEEGVYEAYDLSSRSMAVSAVARGKMFRWMLHSKEPVSIHSLIEIYPVETELITADESRSIQKERPVVEFMIPPTVPPVVFEY